MFRSLTKTLLILAVILGMALPQGMALLAALGFVNGHVMVICTGDGLRTIHIGEDGEPVETGEEKISFCALAHSVDFAVTPDAKAADARFLFTSEWTRRKDQVITGEGAKQSLPRAPPLT